VSEKVLVKSVISIFGSFVEKLVFIFGKLSLFIFIDASTLSISFFTSLFLFSSYVGARKFTLTI
jgi:hypothetical protein